MKDNVYEYWLANVHGLSSRHKIMLEERFHDAKTLYSLPLNELEQISFLYPKHITALDTSRKHWDLDREYEQLKKSGALLITWKNTAYPYRLSQLIDCPYAFYLKGNLPPAGSPTAAIVGARTCSPYGKRQAEELAKELCSAGISVISGMALGIDAAAQRCALDHGGYSLAVLGCGIDICYPYRHHKLYEDLSKNGGIISEFPLTEPPLKTHFPQRNRLISVLSDAVIVVEAREKSGSLITADFALEQGRDVYAVPGPVDSLLSRGCHRLIDQGARIVISPGEIVHDLGASLPKQKHCMSAEDLPALSEDERTILRHLSDSPVKLSQLELMTALDPSTLAGCMVTLQLKGLARELSLQHYVRA